MTMSDITTGLENLGTVFTNGMNVITGNVPMMIFLCAGLTAAAFKLFKRGKKAVR